MSLKGGGVKILGGGGVLVTIVQLDVVQGRNRAPEKENVSVISTFWSPHMWSSLSTAQTSKV